MVLVENQKATAAKSSLENFYLTHGKISVSYTYRISEVSELKRYNQGLTQSQGVVLLSAVCQQYSADILILSMPATQCNVGHFQIISFELQTYSYLTSRTKLVLTLTANLFHYKCSRSHQVSSCHRSSSGCTCWQSSLRAHCAAQISLPTTPRKRTGLVADTNPFFAHPLGSGDEKVKYHLF